MKLFIARHAWAGHYGDRPPADGSWTHDGERPLTPEGAERCGTLYAALAARGFAPEAIATSPLTRCAQTARIAADAAGVASVAPLEALAIGADLDALARWTNAQRVASACWVGHNPDVERLVAALLGDRSAAVRFAKGSVAALRFDGGVVEPGGGELEWHVTAKVVGV
ncbi:MAG: histidine phosphatase family protein [Planctomycetota bacterium]